MGLIPAWLRGGDDRALAADLSAEASRKRRASHRRTGAAKAAREGQAWDDASRQRERNGWRSRR